jgi:hypothetical protein
VCGARRVAVQSLSNTPIRAGADFGFRRGRVLKSGRKSPPRCRTPPFLCSIRGPRSGEHHARSFSFVSRLFRNRIPRLCPGPTGRAARRLRASRLHATCRQGRQVDSLGPELRRGRQRSARHSLWRASPRSDASKRRQSCANLGSAWLWDGDSQRASHHYRPQQQSHHPSLGLDRSLRLSNERLLSRKAGRQKPTIINFLSTRLSDD